ncbi:hypothetical protein DER44DRAFT_210085 [Fusarium oxysporum]|nr:hypothetical protein DER44DRAFT_210085 [Fusarium oxysporum]
MKTLKVEILTTDASLLLARTRVALGMTTWMLFDRRTGEWTTLMRCADPLLPACILSLSKDCALFVLPTVKAEPCVIKVTKSTTLQGKPMIGIKSLYLCRSGEVDQSLFTLSRVGQTISALRRVQDSAILYTWKLRNDWFTDAGPSRQTPEPSTLLLPLYSGKDEIAIVGLVPGSRTHVLGIKFCDDALPEDFIITGQEVPYCPSPPKQDCFVGPRDRAYTYSRVCANWKGIISEDRKLILSKSSAAYGEVVREIRSMQEIQLVAKKPDEWNIFSAKFDHWIRMGKETWSGDVMPRIYLETFELRCTEECQQT